MLKRKYLILWLVGGTVLLAYALGNYYYLINFAYPDFVVKWSMDLYQPSNQEEAANLEIILNFVLSFVAVSVVAFIVLWVKKRITKR